MKSNPKDVYTPDYIKALREYCWLWAGATSEGRGIIYTRGNHVLAYTVMYESTKGKVPTGLVLDHLCEMPLCVNPDHLEPVTRAENLRRHYSRFKEYYEKSCRNGHDRATWIAWHWSTTLNRKQKICKACAKASKKRQQLRKLEAAK